MTSWIDIDGCAIKLSNPDKLLWPEMGITKVAYLKVLIELAPYLIPHTQDRLLMLLRYPNGVDQPSFYQKKAAEHTPEWIDLLQHEGDSSINLNSLATLIWLGNSAALEFHTAFSREGESFLPGLVFDLDPSEGQTFQQVVEVALLIYQELKALNIHALAKTSGASGIQIMIPLERKYTYDDGRKLNAFFAAYFSKKYPNQITIERSVKKRAGLLYFDYLQMWKGKTIISVYSPRAVRSAAVSTPVTWEELERGLVPSDFNLLNIIDRLKKKGDLYGALFNKETQQNLDLIIQLEEKR